VQGLGGSHELVQSLAEFWAESLKELANGDDEDEVNKRRRELEQKSRLSADQLVQLARLLASASSRVLVESLGTQLLSRVHELTDTGKKALEAQLAPEGGLAKFSKADRLRKVGLPTADKSRSGSRKKSRSKSRKKSRSKSRKKSRSRSRKKSRSRSRKKSRGAPYYERPCG